MAKCGQISQEQIIASVLHCQFYSNPTLNFVISYDNFYYVFINEQVSKLFDRNVLIRLWRNETVNMRCFARFDSIFTF